MTASLCPFCGDSNIQEVRKTAFSEKIKGAYFRGLNCSDQRYLLQTLFNCNVCSTSFYEPWLPPGARKEIYETGNHRLGERLYHTYQANKLSVFFIRNILYLQRINSLLATKFRVIDSGCPLSSMTYTMLAYNKYRKAQSSTRIDYLLSKVYRSSLLSTIGYYTLNCVYLLCRPFFLRRVSNGILYRQLLCKLSMLRITGDFSNVVGFTIEKRQRSSAIGWYGSCHVNGRLCSTLVEENLNVPAQGISVFCIVNYLDHIDNPLGFLVDALKRNDCVFFSVHRASDSGFQHKFHFGDKLGDFLRSYLPSHEILSFEDPVPSVDNRGYLGYLIVPKVVNVG